MLLPAGINSPRVFRHHPPIDDRSRFSTATHNQLFESPRPQTAQRIWTVCTTDGYDQLLSLRLRSHERGL